MIRLLLIAGAAGAGLALAVTVGLPLIGVEQPPDVLRPASGPAEPVPILVDSPAPQVPPSSPPAPSPAPPAPAPDDSRTPDQGPSGNPVEDPPQRPLGDTVPIPTPNYPAPPPPKEEKPALRPGDSSHPVVNKTAHTIRLLSDGLLRNIEYTFGVDKDGDWYVGEVPKYVWDGASKEEKKRMQKEAKEGRVPDFSAIRERVRASLAASGAAPGDEEPAGGTPETSPQVTPGEPTPSRPEPVGRSPGIGAVSGTVQRVIGGDSIMINGEKTLYLALLRGGDPYGTALSYTRLACAMGTTITYMEDPRLPVTPTGAVPALVWCTGYGAGTHLTPQPTMNELLITGGHYEVDRKECSRSAFGDEAWAEAMGC